MQLADVIGLPPISPLPKEAKETQFVKGGLPILEIKPSVQRYRKGLESYILLSNWNDVGSNMGFVRSLNGYGFSPGNTDGWLRVAFSGQTPLSEAFSNEFGQSVLLQPLVDVISSGAQEFMYMAGAQKATDFLKQMQESGVPILESAGAAGLKAAGATKGTLQKMFGAESGQTIAKVSDALLAGGKLDFPKIWKNSTYDMNFDISVRLYNPSPGNKELQNKYIIGPMIALLLFVVPRSTDGYSFKWPYVCELRYKGQQWSKAAYVKNISVTYGGDDNSVGWNQRPGLVDLKIAFGSLYNTMLNMEGGGSNDGNSRIPTLTRMIDIMEDEKNLEKPGAVDEDEMKNLANRVPQQKWQEEVNRQKAAAAQAAQELIEARAAERAAQRAAQLARRNNQVV